VNLGADLVERYRWLPFRIYICLPALCSNPAQNTKYRLCFVFPLIDKIRENVSSRDLRLAADVQPSSPVPSTHPPSRSKKLIPNLPICRALRYRCCDRSVVAVHIMFCVSLPRACSCLCLSLASPPILPSEREFTSVEMKSNREDW
jgi:hypothetical protein